MSRSFRFLGATAMMGAIATIGIAWLTPSLLEGDQADLPSMSEVVAEWRPDPGAGGPIALVLNKSFQQFGASYGEVLRAEGISTYSVADLDDLSSLSAFRVAILPETTVTAAQVESLTAWVRNGGTLFVMRPTDELAALAGVSPRSGTLEHGKFKVNSPRWTTIDLALQYHGTADLRVPLSGTEVVATLARRDGALLGAPAITVRHGIAPGNGTVVSFMFDLGRSVVLTRQGDPQRVGKPRQLDSYMSRSGEFFAGREADPEATFLDMSLFEIPQADELQRVFVDLLQRTGAHGIPFPRFWYLPGGRKVAVVMTSDDHNADRTDEFFDDLLGPAHSPAGCSAHDWTCARATSWVYGRVEALKKPGVLRRYIESGFEVGPHLVLDRDGPCATWQDIDDLLSRFAARQREFRRDYGIPPSPTNRTHCYLFSDWDAEVRVQRRLGIRLDSNYTAYGLPGWLGRLGRVNGSGIPIRFAARDGSLHDVYQLASDFSSDDFTDATDEQARAALRRALDDATGPRGFWGFIGTHFDFSVPGERVRNTILAEVYERNQGREIHDQIAMISARQLLDWLDLRNRSSFRNLAFDGERLTFALAVDDSLPNPGLEAMLPIEVGGRRLARLTRNGASVAVHREAAVRTVRYAFFSAVPGSGYVAEYRK